MGKQFGQQTARVGIKNGNSAECEAILLGLITASLVLAQLAAQIYKGFGRWSSVCSGIACWALIAAETRI